MKIIKGLICLGIFSTILYGSDYDVHDQQNTNSDDNSLYGVYPALYTKKYAKQIDQLEKELSEKKPSKVYGIPLSKALESESEESDSCGFVLVAHDTNDISLESEDENERQTSFHGLCRRLSSMKSSLSRFSSENSQKNNSQRIDNAHKTVDALISRLVVIGKSNNLLVPYEFHDCSILDLDQGVDSQASHKSSDILSLLERQKAGISEELSKSGSFKNSSLNLEIPKALSFKYVRNERSLGLSEANSYADSYIVQAVRTNSNRKCDSQLFGKEELSDKEEGELEK